MIRSTGLPVHGIYPTEQLIGWIFNYDLSRLRQAWDENYGYPAGERMGSEKLVGYYYSGNGPCCCYAIQWNSAAYPDPKSPDSCTVSTKYQ
jgi:hypothetical protein